MYARRRTADTLALTPLAHTSGRFDSFIDMGNPLKGINLFPNLQRRVEGRALAGMGPATVLELSALAPRGIFCYVLTCMPLL
jgi:hypothetical protein